MNWSLIGWSFAVIRRHKQLILFPVLSVAVSLIGLYFCFLLRSTRVPGPQNYLWLAIAYFVITFAMVFFNSALAACANAHFAGDKPTLAYGLRHAVSRLAPIFAWAALSTTVGLILNVIERRVPWAGKIAVWISGGSWALATYLVVPVLIAEDRSAIGSVRRSVQLFRDTWGDQLVAQIRFFWQTLLIMAPGIVLGIVAANGYRLLWPLAVASFILGVAVLTAARQIFQVALYRHAALGETPADWSRADLPGFFRV